MTTEQSLRDNKASKERIHRKKTYKINIQKDRKVYNTYSDTIIINKL